MNLNVNGMNNVTFITLIENVIQKETLKLKKDKEEYRLKMEEKLQKLNENDSPQVSLTGNCQNYLTSYSPKIKSTPERVAEIERLANIFSQSPSYFNSYNNNNNNIDFKYNSEVFGKTPVYTQNDPKVSNYEPTNNVKTTEEQENIFSFVPKVTRNVRFGEFSPLHPGNQTNSKPYLGIGEYDNKRKQVFQQTKKEFMEYLAKEDERRAEKKYVDEKTKLTKCVAFIDGSESCNTTEYDQIKINKTKQELYRQELKKQIEEKKTLEKFELAKQILEDARIEKEAREKDEKSKREYEKEMEDRELLQIHKRMIQEKLKENLLEKQKSFENKHVKFSKPEELNEESSINVYSSDCHKKQIEPFPNNSFDDVPLPTTRNLPRRKVMYKDTNTDLIESDNIAENQKDINENAYMNQSISPISVRSKMLVVENVTKLPKELPSHKTLTKTKPSQVSFEKDFLINNDFISYKNCNSAALSAPSNKSSIIDSPHTLAITETDDFKQYKCASRDEAINKYPESEAIDLESIKELSDTELLCNLENIKRQLQIDHMNMEKKLKIIN